MISCNVKFDRFSTYALTDCTWLNYQIRGIFYYKWRPNGTRRIKPLQILFHSMRQRVKNNILCAGIKYLFHCFIPIHLIVQFLVTVSYNSRKILLIWKCTDLCLLHIIHVLRISTHRISVFYNSSSVSCDTRAKKLLYAFFVGVV